MKSPFRGQLLQAPDLPRTTEDTLRQYAAGYDMRQITQEVQAHLQTVTQQSALGEWTHSEFTPRHLAHVVEKMWHFEGRMSLLRERSFPRVYLEIILQLGPRYREVDSAGNSLDLFPVACLGGATVAPTVIEAPNARCCVMGIQLSALGAYRLTGIPPGGLIGLSVAVEDALGAESAFLTDRCYDADSVAARFALVAHFIEQRMVRSRAPNCAIAWATAQLHRPYQESINRSVQHEQQWNRPNSAGTIDVLPAGAATIAEVQRETGYSKPRFIALFREHTGFAPKQYARIIRFRRALASLQQGGALSPTALQCGYYDHAHMCRDFAEFAHMSPNAFVTARRFPNSMSLPEAAECD